MSASSDGSESYEGNAYTFSYTISLYVIPTGYHGRTMVIRDSRKQLKGSAYTTISNATIWISSEGDIRSGITDKSNSIYYRKFLELKQFIPDDDINSSHVNVIETVIIKGTPQPNGNIITKALTLDRLSYTDALFSKVTDNNFITNSPVSLLTEVTKGCKKFYAAFPIYPPLYDIMKDINVLIDILTACFGIIFSGAKSLDDIGTAATNTSECVANLSDILAKILKII